MKAMLDMDSFRGESSLAVWLCSIAKRTWYMKLKRKKRRAPEPEHKRPTNVASKS